MPTPIGSARSEVSTSSRRPLRGRWIALAGAIAAAAIACGSSSSPAAPVAQTDDHDATTMTPDDDAGEAPDVDNPAMFGESTDGGGPLEARIQVNGGAGIVCGGCAILGAQVQGGKAPYSYAWSDPSLRGPGPFTVCPTQATSYS